MKNAKGAGKARGGGGGGGGSDGGNEENNSNINTEDETIGRAHADGSYTYRGQRVRVKERVRVGNQDPALMAALAKLSALEHHVAVNRNSLGIVMGGGTDGDGDEDDEEEITDEEKED